MGEKAYVFGGRGDNSVIYNDMYIYDASNDQWSDAVETPLQKRVNGCACVVGDKAYIGLGFCGYAYGDDAYLNDWWEYTPATDTWKRLCDFPNENTVGAIGYTDGNRVYCVHGFGWGFTTDVLCYDIASDTWTAIDRRRTPDIVCRSGTNSVFPFARHVLSRYPIALKINLIPLVHAMRVIPRTEVVSSSRRCSRTRHRRMLIIV